MSKTKAAKAASVEMITRALAEAKGVAFVNFSGLTVKDAAVLRRQCRSAGVTYLVVKKTLLKLALERSGVSAVDPAALGGEIAVAFGMSDELVAPKTLDEFAGTHPALRFVGGLVPSSVGWRFMSASEVAVLAKLPGRHELLGQLVGMVANPLRGLVGVLSGPLRGFVQALRAVEQAKARG
jgi:large subunit ribosomal protein L10